MAEIFGNNNKEANPWSTGGQVNACKFTSGSAGTLEKISVYVKQNVANTPLIKCHLYDASRNKVVNGATEELLLGAGQDGWMHFDFLVPPTVAAATVYWLAFFNDTTSTTYRGDGAAAQTSLTGGTYPTWPATLAAGSIAWIFSIYATYVVPPQPPTAPTSLEVDGKSSPIGANCITTSPEFSAIFNDPDAGDISNAIQIQVGSASGLSDLWDSGWLADTTIESNACSVKTYAGASLSAGTNYYWRCRFRDDENNVGAWSSWQEFEMCSVVSDIEQPGGSVPKKQPFAQDIRQPVKLPVGTDYRIG